MTGAMRERAGELGYQSAKCPDCGRQCGSDTGRFICDCGYDSQPEGDDAASGAD